MGNHEVLKATSSSSCWQSIRGNRRSAVVDPGQLILSMSHQLPKWSGIMQASACSWLGAAALAHAWLVRMAWCCSPGTRMAGTHGLVLQPWHTHGWYAWLGAAALAHAWLVRMAWCCSPGTRMACRSQAAPQVHRRCTGLHACARVRCELRESGAWARHDGARLR
jgi:hypothetical protein